VDLDTGELGETCGVSSRNCTGRPGAPETSGTTVATPSAQRPAPGERGSGGHGLALVEQQAVHHAQMSHLRGRDGQQLGAGGAAQVRLRSAAERIE
jgi:hypothetical protein